MMNWKIRATISSMEMTSRKAQGRSSLGVP
jgi:hypothetical protein